MIQVVMCCKDQSVVPVVEEYLKTRNCWYELQYFSTVEEILIHLESTPADLIFMEVDSEQTLEAARVIAEKCMAAKEVVIDNLKDYIEEKQEVKCFFHISRELLEEEMPIIMDKFFMMEHYLRRRKLLVNSKGGQIILEIKDLIYVERDKRNSTLYCSDGDRIVTPDDLAVMQEMIGRDDFIRCHNSYMVNLNYVRELRRSEFVLKNGIEIPISRRYLEEVRRRLKLWVESVW